MSASAAELKLKQIAIRAYKNLLRAQRKVFGSDIATMNEAWSRSRAEFESNRFIKDLEILKSKIEETQNITQFLEKNLVQGVLNLKSDSKPLKLKLMKDLKCGITVRMKGQLVVVVKTETETEI